jgi:hypothetical protein
MYYDMGDNKWHRTIQIPIWMDKVLSEIATRNNRSVNLEIQHLVESALRECESGKKCPTAIQCCVREDCCRFCEFYERMSI